MSLLVEAYRVQHLNTPLHSEKLFYYKIALLLFIASSFAWGGIYIYIVVSIFIGVHYLLGKIAKLIILELYMYIPPTLLIIGIDYLAGTLNIRVIELLLFGYTSFTGMILFYATTPIQQLYDMFGRNPLTMAMLMLHNVVAELYSIVESKKIRGWEPGWNLYRHFIIVFEAIRLLNIRLYEITIALKSRGVE